MTSSNTPTRTYCSTVEYGGPEVHSRFPFPVRRSPSFVPRFSRFPFPVRHLPSFVPRVSRSSILSSFTLLGNALIWDRLLLAFAHALTVPRGNGSSWMVKPMFYCTSPAKYTSIVFVELLVKYLK